MASPNLSVAAPSVRLPTSGSASAWARLSTRTERPTLIRSVPCPKRFISRGCPARGTPSIITSVTDVSRASIRRMKSLPVWPLIAIRSARFPASMEPSKLSQCAIFAGLVVTIATSSSAENSAPFSWLASQATLSSPSRFLEPLGAQSEPSAVRIPERLTASSFTVSPYNR